MLGRTIRRLVADYRLNWIYAPGDAARVPGLPPATCLVLVGEEERRLMASDPDPKVRKALCYQQAGARGYALLHEKHLASVAHFADTACYDHSSTWPLARGQVALVDIVTTTAKRGQGLAAPLIRAATEAVTLEGAITFAFIWWTHVSSRRAFAKAGWRPIGFSIEIERRNRRIHSLHLRFPAAITRLLP